MAKTDLLRSSRDGDQFHYHWAARQALGLLRPDTALTALAIEGVSPDDKSSDGDDEVIDVAEYWGGDAVETADIVIYRQLKHSTATPHEERTASYLSKTLRGFARKYASLKGQPGAAAKASFEFVCIPPIASSVKTALNDLANNRTPEKTEPAKYIREQLETTLLPGDVATFCQHFRIRDGEPGLLQLRTTYANDVAAFLPGAGGTQDILLREMVSTRASSIAGSDLLITRATVLSALRVTEEMLLPAPNLIEAPAAIVDVPDVAETANILTAAQGPVIAHASGGMGKSVLATTIADHLPTGSIAVLYDCFGNGGYRRISSRRHEHRQALLQLANELASAGLCDPVMPSDTAGGGDYMRIFLDRLKTAQRTLHAQTPGALLVVVVDAADNAVMAARDTGTPSFVPDLVREQLPDGVRLLMLCRTERLDYLEPGPSSIKHALTGFDAEHSRAHLELRYGQVEDRDALEFHLLTDRNPRVQALAMAGADTVQDALRSLGALVEGDGAPFDQLLRQRISEIREDFGREAHKLERLCVALAALRPRIPVAVLALVADVPPDLVRSFAADFGRALLTEADTVQFRDEPTETWFQTEFRPTGASLTTLIAAVRPLADKHPYLSASLPQLLFEAGHVRELVDLALSDDALSASNEVERREIAHERAQFALRAALRDRRLPDAARLAWRTGELSAGETRRIELIRTNTDLAGRFLDPQVIDSLLAKRALTGSWPGSHLHVEGALLAATNTSQALARSRVRSGVEWTRTWVREAAAHHRSHDVSQDDIAELAFGMLTVEGPKACADFLGAWSPPWLAYTVGKKVARRLVDHDRRHDLELLASAAGHVERLQLAVAAVATEAGVDLSASAVRRATRMLRKHGAPLKIGASQRTVDPTEVAWVLVLALRHGLLNTSQAQAVLGRYLPSRLPHGAGDRHQRNPVRLLFAFAVHAHLAGQPLESAPLEPSDVSKARERTWERSRSVTDYDNNIVPLLKWAALSAEVALGGTSSQGHLTAFRALMPGSGTTYSQYEAPYTLINGVAQLASHLLVQLPVDQDDMTQYTEWVRTNLRHVHGTTLTKVARRCASNPKSHDIALSVAALRRQELTGAHMPAEEKATAYVALARATYAFDPQEASADFGRAIDITSHIGEDAHDRWRATTTIATNAADGTDRPAEAYRLAQVAEGLHDYLGDNGRAADALRQIGSLSTNTALAIGSRWRDRRVADPDMIVSALTHESSKLARAHPKWTIGLVPLGARDANAALARIPDPTQRATAQAVVNHWFRTPTEAPARKAPTTTDDDVTPEIAGNEPTPTTINVEEFDLTTSAGWDLALEVLTHHKWKERNSLFEHASNLPPAQLRPMVEAFTAATRPVIHDYSRLLEQLEQRNPLPEGARHAIGELVDRMTERFSKQLTTRGFDPVDHSTITKLCGRFSTTIIDAAFEELGSSSEQLEASECFELAARLSQRITAAENLTLLKDATDSFLAVAPLDSADGTYAALPVTPPTLETCVAAFVWAAAGDPAKATRWQAAHTIRMWLTLGCVELAEAIADLSTEANTDVAAFTDDRFVFYERHALMWTLMATARAAHEPAALMAVTRLQQVLRRIAFEGPPNAVLQHNAKAALLKLAEGGELTTNDEERTQLDEIDTPALVLLEAGEYARPRKTDVHLAPNAAALDVADPQGGLHETADGQPGDKPSSTAALATEDDDELPRWERPETRFSFFFDFQEHWCRPLGQAFGIAERRIVELVDELIVDRWQSPLRGKYDEDARHHHQVYGEGGTHSYKSDWPAEDDLDFYLTTHALYEVAGHLARTYPAYCDPSNEGDDYSQWLRSHTPTRTDGRWIADRRDSRPHDLPPLDDPSPEHAGERTTWRYQVSRSRFDAVATPDDKWITLDGYWTTADYGRSETVYIDSALVDRHSAPALLRALASSPNLYFAHLPRRPDETPHEPPFDLVRVAQTPYVTEGIDAEDPAADGIAWPPPAPAPEVITALGISPDADQRDWKSRDDIMIRTTVWSADGHSDSETGGRRLQSTRDAVTKLLHQTGRSFLLSVELRRHVTERYGQDRQRDDELDHLQPYKKFTLIHLDGGSLEFTS